MKRLLLFLTCVLTLFGVSKAATATFDFTTEAGWKQITSIAPPTAASSGSSVTGVALTLDGISITSTKGTADAQIWKTNNGFQYRVYNGATMTFSSANTITNIVITDSNGTYTVNGAQSKSWSGNANSVVFNVTKNGQITKIEVTYVASDPSKTDAELYFDNLPATVKVGKSIGLSQYVKSKGGYTSNLFNYSVNNENARIDGGDLIGVTPGKVEVTASIPSDVATFTGSVTQEIEVISDGTEPITYIDVLNAANCTNITGSYGSTYYESKVTGIKYNFYACVQSQLIQFNNSSSRNCGLAVTSNPNGYNVKSITIEFDGAKDITVYSASSAYESVEKFYSNNGSSIGTLTSTNTKISPSASLLYWAMKPAATGLVKITSITIEYSKDDNGKKSADISFANSTAEAPVGQTDFNAPALSNPNNLSVSYTSSNDKVATVDGNGKVTLSAIGVTTITATTKADDTYEEGTASYTLTVTPNDGQVLSVAEALAAIDNDYTGEATAQGYISEIENYNKTYSSLTYNIVDEEGTKNPFLQAYSGKWKNGEGFTENNPEVEVGGFVTVKGNLKKYNQTYEFVMNNEVVDYTAPANAELGDIVVTVSTGQTVENEGSLEVVQGTTITFTARNAEKIELLDDELIYETDIEGEQLTITATDVCSNNDIYVRAEKGGEDKEFYFTLTVTEAPEVEGDVYTLVENVEDITEDGEYILVANYGNQYSAMSSTETSNKMTPVVIKSLDDKNMLVEEENVLKLNVEIGTAEGSTTYVWKNDNGTLYSNSSTNVKFGNSTTSNNHISTVSIDENNYVNISFKRDATRIVMVNNTGSNNTYGYYLATSKGTSGYYQPKLYKKASGYVVSDPTPELYFEFNGEKVGDDVKVNWDATEFPTLHTPDDAEFTVTYSSSDTDVAEIDAEGNITLKGVDGDAVIKATTAAIEGQYAEGSVEYTLIVLDPNSQKAMFDFTVENAYGMTSTSNNNSYEPKKTITGVENGVNMTITGKFRSWSGSDGYDLRLYKEDSNKAAAKLTFTVPVGYKIEEIVFNGSSLNNINPSAGALTTANSNKEGSWSLNAENTDEEVNSVTFTAKETVYISNATVYYTLGEELFFLSGDMTNGDTDPSFRFIKQADGTYTLDVAIMSANKGFVVKSTWGNSYTYTEDNGVVSAGKNNNGDDWSYNLVPGTDKMTLDKSYLNLKFTFNPDGNYFVIKGTVDEGADWTFHYGNDKTNQSGEVQGVTHVISTVLQDEKNNYFAVLYVHAPSAADKVYYKVTPTTSAKGVRAAAGDGYKEAEKGEDGAHAIRLYEGEGEVDLYYTDEAGTESEHIAVPYKVITTSDPLGVDGLEAEEAEAEYFTLQGVKVANPEKGIYIKVVNGKASKVVK